MTQQDIVSFEWAVSESELDAQRQALLDAGAELADETYPFKPPDYLAEEYLHAAFEPMLVLVGALAIGFLADRVVRVIKDIKKGGLIIDSRGEKLAIFENSALDRGTVLVFSNAGVKQFDSSKPVDIVGAIKALKPGG